ncbi:hypothetical protein O185_12430 [Photorhabdus temperata J3]|uniref:Uncharacterized protein n=1 Tax=Photorhabdus temperata J3 TaxID=1389415 RepID=U7QXF3_PHOTE|nr:hypothetical protein O185_12430 [Photorhabdus temperata J3]
MAHCYNLNDQLFFIIDSNEKPNTLKPDIDQNHFHPIYGNYSFPSVSSLAITIAKFIKLFFTILHNENDLSTDNHQ